MGRSWNVTFTEGAVLRVITTDIHNLQVASMRAYLLMVNGDLFPYAWIGPYAILTDRRKPWANMVWASMVSGSRLE